MRVVVDRYTSAENFDMQGYKTVHFMHKITIHEIFETFLRQGSQAVRQAGRQAGNKSFQTDKPKDRLCE